MRDILYDSFTMPLAAMVIACYEVKPKKRGKSKFTIAIFKYFKQKSDVKGKKLVGLFIIPGELIFN